MALYKKLNPMPKLKQLFNFGQEQPPAVSGDFDPDWTGEAGKHGPGAAWDYFSREMSLAQERMSIYNELEQMDEDDVISAVLDLYAEDATQMELTTGKVVWIESENEDIKEILNDLFQRLSIDDEAAAIAREIALYGDSFSSIIQELSEEGMPHKIIALKPIDPKTIWREEDKLGRLKGFRRGKGTMDDSSSLSQPWDYLHFRLRGKHRTSMYGYGVITGARRMFRMLKMMEQALVIYRLKRAPDRLVFALKGLGGLAPEQRFRILNRIRRTVKKKLFRDPSADKTQTETNPLALDEDLFIDGDSVDVQHFQSTARVDHVLDVEYVKKRLFMSLRVPPDYLGQAEARGGLLAQSPLAHQDVQFARQVKRLQRALIDGFVRLAQIDLAWRDIDPLDSSNDFSVNMQPVSYLDEMQRSNLVRIRAETILLLEQIGQAMELDRKAWLKYVFRLSGFPEEVLNQIAKEGGETAAGDLEGEVELTGSEKKTMDKVLQSDKLTQLLEDQEVIQNLKKCQPSFKRSSESRSEPNVLHKLLEHRRKN